MISNPTLKHSAVAKPLLLIATWLALVPTASLASVTSFVSVASLVPVASLAAPSAHSAANHSAPAHPTEPHSTAPHSTSTNPAPALVASTADLRAYMTAHIKRVRILGNHLIEHYARPLGLEATDQALVAKFLRLHDLSKINQSKGFVRRYYRAAQAALWPLIPERLVEIFGKSGDEAFQDLRRQVIKDLNAIDTAVAREFFSKMGLLDSEQKPGPKALALLRLEKIADLVDRGSSPAAAIEFNRPMTPASQFLSDRTDRRLARELEAVYFELVGRQPLIRLCERFFGSAPFQPAGWSPDPANP